MTAVPQPAWVDLSGEILRCRHVASRCSVASLDSARPGFGSLLLCRNEGAGVAASGELTEDPRLQSELVLDNQVHKVMRNQVRVTRRRVHAKVTVQTASYGDGISTFARSLEPDLHGGEGSNTTRSAASGFAPLATFTEIDMATRTS